MIHYVARVRVRGRTVFAFQLTTVASVKSVVEVGHRWEVDEVRPRLGSQFISYDGVKRRQV